MLTDEFILEDEVLPAATCQSFFSEPQAVLFLLSYYQCFGSVILFGDVDDNSSIRETLEKQLQKIKRLEILNQFSFSTMFHYQPNYPTGF